MNLLYKVMSLLVSVIGGMLAVKVFNQVWKKARGEEHAPDARDLDRGWREVLLAAAAQGAVYGLVKAATRRAAVRSVSKGIAKSRGSTTGRTRPEPARSGWARRERVPAGHRGR